MTKKKTPAKKNSKKKKPEAELRDYLAENLSKIEPGLVLIQKEYLLKNDIGAKGYVDILARDQYGHRVVIEIKRNDKTARQALHELHKYAELLQKNQGLAVAEVRCVLVSTDWHELTVPFSAFVRESPYSVTGYRVEVADGLVDKIVKVDPVAAPQPLSPLRLHSAFLFRSQKKQKNFLPKLDKAMLKAGIASAVIVMMSAKPDRKDIVYPYCVYVMICDVTEEARSHAIAGAKKEAGEFYEEGDPSSFEGQINHEMIKAAGKQWDSLESGYPEKFATQLQFWTIDTIKRTGRLLDDKLITDDDLLNHLIGFSGTGQIAYNSTASPAYPAAWATAKQRVLQCLIGMPHWTEVAKIVFQEVEKIEEHTTVGFHLYCPCDTVMMLYQLYGNDDQRFIPKMDIIWKSESSETPTMITGVVGWDGKTRPRKPKRLLADIFDNDDTGYFLARHFGATVDYDERVMKRHGLSYHVARWTVEEGDARGAWLTVKNEKLSARGIEVRSPKPLHTFVEENVDYLSELVNWFRANSFGA